MQFQTLVDARFGLEFEADAGATLELRSLDNGRHFASPILPEGSTTLPGVQVSNCLITAPDTVISPHRFGNGSTFVRRWFTVLRASVSLIEGRAPRHVLIKEQPTVDAQERDALLLWLPKLDLELGEWQGDVQELMKGLYRFAAGASAQLHVMDRAATRFGNDRPRLTFTVSWELRDGRHQLCVDGNAIAQRVLWR